MNKKEYNNWHLSFVIALGFLLFFPLMLPAQEQEELTVEHKTPYMEKNNATLYVLEKTTGIVKKINIPVGEKNSLHNLHIMVQTCRVQLNKEGKNEVVFLTIEEDTIKQTATGKSLNKTSKDVLETKEIFSGWMFADAPSLSILENKNYDVWLEHCS